MNRISSIIIHQAPIAHGDRYILDRWYRDQGFPGVPFHWVICNGWREPGVWVPALEGQLVQCLPPEVAPTNSLGICLIGEKGRFSAKQHLALRDQVKTLMGLYRIAIDSVRGAYETDRAQAVQVPDFSMEMWRRDFMKWTRKG